MNSESNQILSDSDLIKGSIDGNRHIQELLYKKFSGKMYGVCLRYAGNESDANDIMQDGFIKVFNNLEKFRGDGSFEGWIRRIIVNTSIEHFRRKKKTFNITETQENYIEDTSLDALDVLATKDLMHIINELPPGYKMVFNMHIIEGYSHKEIADTLGITEGTSKSQLARAKGVLRKIIEDRVNPSDLNKIIS